MNKTLRLYFTGAYFYVALTVGLVLIATAANKAVFWISLAVLVALTLAVVKVHKRPWIPFSQ